MLTKITKASFEGKPFTGERDATDNRRLAKRKKDRSKTSKPAETRPGKPFPGGRHMRRALKNLSARQNGFVPAVKGHECRKPGSMRS